MKTILEHLKTNYGFDLDEIHPLLELLQSSLLASTVVLSGQDVRQIYQCTHSLHSELHSCGHESLSELAAHIELQARQGVIARGEIDHLQQQIRVLSTDIAQWLSGHA